MPDTINPSHHSVLTRVSTRMVCVVQGTSQQTKCTAGAAHTSTCCLPVLPGQPASQESINSRVTKLLREVPNQAVGATEALSVRRNLCTQRLAHGIGQHPKRCILDPDAYAAHTSYLLVTRGAKSLSAAARQLAGTLPVAAWANLLQLHKLRGCGLGSTLEQRTKCNSTLADILRKRP